MFFSYKPARTIAAGWGEECGDGRVLY